MKNDERTKKLWLLLLKGVTEGKDSWTEAEVKQLLREPELRYTAEEAAGLVNDLDNISEEKQIRRGFMKISPRKLLKLIEKNKKEKRRFLWRHRHSEAPTEDSNYGKLNWIGGLLRNALEARRKLVA